ARVSPEQKLRIARALRARGHVVAMTGDGVNDAPALKSADIGVAMGIAGTEVTRQAATMILADDNFATIVAAVAEGRGIFANIRKFLRYLLSSNTGEVLTVFAGVMLAVPLGLTGHGEAVVVPLLAVQILWINLLTDTGPALAMGVDPQPDDVMGRPPRRAEDRVIDRPMWSGVLVTGSSMAVAVLLTIDLLLPGGLLAGTADLATARTAGFTVLVLAQLVNALAARSERASVVVGIWDNGWLWAAIGVSLALQVAVVHAPVLQDAFGTVPLTAEQWLLAAAAAAAVLVVSELRKAVARLAAARRSSPAGGPTEGPPDGPPDGPPGTQKVRHGVRAGPSATL
ncbi:MAG TPA: HAD-IC family P-type ATPase, partial [Actinotalea sp.]|nr:HAD-IC family P-type ATPase [Actinotalea sp.]